MSSIKQKTTEFNSTGLYSLMHKQLLGSLAAFARYIETEDLPAPIKARYADALEEARTALGSLLCDACETEPIADSLGTMVLCSHCLPNWILCDGCGDPMPMADATSIAAWTGHAACAYGGKE